jgi:hypothetical protein
MSLIVPPEIRVGINQYSGFIDPDTKYGKHTAKALFLCPANIKYLAKELYLILINPKFVSENLGDTDLDFLVEEKTRKSGVTAFNNRAEGLIKKRTQMLITNFKKSRQQIANLTLELAESVGTPAREDVTIENPVMNLHLMNRDFLIQTGKTIIQSPEVLVADFIDVNPDTGETDFHEYEYGPSSYNTGTWQPEQLFTNSYRNRNNPYWVLTQVSVDQSPDAKQSPGHRYKSKAYWGSGVRERVSQFPEWQSSVNDRPYSHFDGYWNESFREGGTSDRRTNPSWSRFDMSALISKSTY